MRALKLKGYLELVRVTNLPSIWVNVLAATLLSAGSFSLGAYLVPAFALSCLYLAGMSLNDLCDLAHDRLHRPARPMPSGRVSRAGAWALTLLLFTTGLGLLAFSHHTRSLLGALVLVAAIVWYDLNHKRHAYSVLVMAACRFLVYPVSALSVSSTVPALVLLAGALQLVWVLAVSLVSRHENEREAPFSLPVIPLMLAAIPVLDGSVLSVFVHPVWLLAGAGGAALMQLGQRWVRGD